MCVKISSTHVQSWLVLHQQDTMGGRFDVTQSFIGELSDLQFWSRVLTANEIYSQATCESHLVGDVLSWSEESVELHGGLTEYPFEPCHWGLTPDMYHPELQHDHPHLCEDMILTLRTQESVESLFSHQLDEKISFSAYAWFSSYWSKVTSLANRQGGRCFAFFLSAFSTFILTSSLWHRQQDDFEGSNERRALDLPAVWSRLRLLCEIYRT